MRVMMVLPRRDVPGEDFRRCLKSVQLNLPGSVVTIESPPGWAMRHQDTLGAAVIEGYPPDFMTAFDAIAFLEYNGDQRAIELAERLEKGDRLSVYRFNLDQPYCRAQMLPVRVLSPAEYNPHHDDHVFGRLAPSGTDFFHYFPYGYLFRCVGLGPINGFGFRIADNPGQMETRPTNHKVIAVFGGSSAWSLDCLYDEMFSAVLERLLTERLAERGSDVKVTVLNFGQHGNVVLNEILTYTLFCNRLRPDIVLAHDGFNDLAYGMATDPTLLLQGLCYQFNLEAWAGLLHDTMPTAEPGAPAVKREPRNAPQTVIRAYIRRKQQFQRLVEADGGRFVWGLQPTMESKAALSASEQAFVSRVLPSEDPVEPIMALMKDLYEMMLANVPLLRQVDFVNFHQEFAKYGADRTLFADKMHTTPDGDRVIAERYADHLIDALIGPVTGEPQ